MISHAFKTTDQLLTLASTLSPILAITSGDGPKKKKLIEQSFFELV